MSDSALTSAFLDRTLPTVPENLALDDALLREAEANDGPSLLRLWEPDRFAVVLGASGRIHDEVQRDACSRDGVPIFRRTSGGGTVLIGPGVLNFSVILPIAADSALRNVETAQLFVMNRVANALNQRGASVQIRGSGDLARDDRKICGSAQRRLRRWVLIHATILNTFDLDAIPRYLGQPRREPAYRQGRSHAAFVTNLGLPASTLRAAVQAAWLPDQAAPSEPTIPWDRVGPITDEIAQSAWIERF